MKTICMLTNWYPTKENPYRGVFFKEQAFSMKDDFNFVVIKDYQHVCFNIFKRKKYNIKRERVEENTVEYILDVYTPFIYYVLDIIKSNYIVLTKNKYVDGIGSYMSRFHKIHLERTYTAMFHKVSEQIDYLYCVDAQVEAYKLQLISKAINKPYVIGEHAPVPWTGRLIYDVNKYAIENADMFLAISNDKIRQLMMQGIRLPETVYLGNLIDETKFDLKNKINEEKVLLIVAANSFYKNFDMFLDVIEKLNNMTTMPFKVMIVGYGANKGYSKDVNQFEEKIKKLSFYEKVVLIREVVHDKMNEIYSQADAFIMTSVQEGQPVSALEAACCGIPIFSTRCGGVEDYVDDEIGRLFDLTDTEGMARELCEYVEGRILFDSKIIRNKIIKLYGTEKFKDSFKKAFEAIDYTMKKAEDNS